MRQGQFCVHPLQPGILGFEFLKPPQLRDIQSAVLGLPVDGMDCSLGLRL